MKLLLLEDDLNVAKPLVDALRLAGLQVRHESTVAGARDRIRSENWDFFLFDVNLPDGSGIHLCEYAQREFPEIPVIVMTGRTDEESAIRGFSSGAVDFVRKPVGHREILLRIKRALGERESLRFGSIEIRVHAREANVNGTPVKLPPREFDILARLVKRPDQLIARQELEPDSPDSLDSSEGRPIDGHISRLRTRLKKAGAHDVQITTTYGVGYMIRKAS